MREHGAFASAASPAGRFVASSLGFGESEIARPATSVKIVLSGEEGYEIDGQRHALKPGLMLIVPPGATIRATVTRREPALGICLDLPPSCGDFSGLPVLAQSTRASSFGQALAHIGARMFRTPDTRHDSIREIVAIAARDVPNLIGHSLEVANSIKAEKPPTRIRLMLYAERARAYLDDHRQRAVPLAELSGAVGLSPYALARCFQAAFNEGPAAYHRRMRLEDARLAIREGTLSPTTAAITAGYSDLSAFSKAYRRSFGHAPIERQM